MILFLWALAGAMLSWGEYHAAGFNGAFYVLGVFFIGTSFGKRLASSRVAAQEPK